jgi:hypothetical protein
MESAARTLVLVGIAALALAEGAARADFRCDPTCYPGAPQRPPCDDDRIICEGSGSKAALALNLVRYRLMEAMIAYQARDMKVCRAAIQAVHNTRLATVQMREELRRTGTRMTDLRYLSGRGDQLDEAALFHQLDSTDAESVTVFDACGGTTLRDDPTDAMSFFRGWNANAIRSVGGSHPSAELGSGPIRCVAPGSACGKDAACCQDGGASAARSCIAGICRQSTTEDERVRLDTLYDTFAERMTALLRESVQRPYRSQVGATLALATLMAPPAFAATGEEVKRHGFTVEELTALVKRDPGLAERETERYLRTIKPVLQLFMSRMRGLPAADTEDCRQLVRTIVMARASAGPGRSLADALLPTMKSCKSLLPARTTRGLEFDRCNTDDAGAAR